MAARLYKIVALQYVEVTYRELELVHLGHKHGPSARHPEHAAPGWTVLMKPGDESPGMVSEVVSARTLLPEPAQTPWPGPYVLPAEIGERTKLGDLIEVERIA